MHAGDVNQGAENCRGNAGAGEKPRCRKMQGQNVKGAGELHENEGGTEKNQMQENARNCSKLWETKSNS